VAVEGNVKVVEKKNKSKGFYFKINFVSDM